MVGVWSPDGGMASGGSMVPERRGVWWEGARPRHADTCKNIAFQQFRLRAVTVHCIGGSNFFHFHAFYGKKLRQIIGFCPKLRGWRPRLGNPGSTTAVLCYFPTNMNFLIIDVSHKCSFPRKKITRCRTLGYFFFNFS